MKYEVWVHGSFLLYRQTTESDCNLFESFSYSGKNHNFLYQSTFFVRILVYSSYFAFDLLSNNNIISKSNSVANFLLNFVTSVHVYTSNDYFTFKQNHQPTHKMKLWRFFSYYYYFHCTHDLRFYQFPLPFLSSHYYFRFGVCVSLQLHKMNVSYLPGMKWEK